MRLGDAVRFVNIARQLRPRHTFDLICYFKLGQGLSDEAREVFDQVTMVPYPVEDTPSPLARALRSLTLSSIAPRNQDMKDELVARLSAGSYELVFCNGASTLLNLPRKPLDVPVVCDSIDSMSLTIEREWQSAPLHQRLKLVRRILHDWQLRNLVRARADADVFASELDAALAARLDPTMKTVGIPNGVDSSYFHPGDVHPEGNAIVFEGNMMFGPNIDAARYLCAEIVPRVVKRHAKLRVYLVGRDPTAEVLDLKSDHVVVTGTVPDVRPYLWRSSVFVCPMRLGAGIKNKILQAWACGLPVVATSQALGGLGAIDGENVFLRDDPVSFAAAVCEILENPERGKRVALGGRSMALDNFSWAAQAEKLESLFFEVVKSRRTMRAS
jgi:glycosyltransferase involved in cell wall biosynthesis